SGCSLFLVISLAFVVVLVLARAGGVLVDGGLVDARSFRVGSVRARADQAVPPHRLLACHRPLVYRLVPATLGRTDDDPVERLWPPDHVPPAAQRLPQGC